MQAVGTNQRGICKRLRTEPIIGAAEIRPGPWCVFLSVVKVTTYVHTPFELAQTTFSFYAEKNP